MTQHHLKRAATVTVVVLGLALAGPAAPALAFDAPPEGSQGQCASAFARAYHNGLSPNPFGRLITALGLNAVTYCQL